MANTSDKKTRVFVTEKICNKDESTVEFLKSGTESYHKRRNNQTEPIAWFGGYTLADLAFFKELMKTRDLGEIIDTVRFTTQAASPEIIIYSDPKHRHGYGIRKVVEIREE